MKKELAEKLYEHIFIRKSTRKYNMSPLDEKDLKQIGKFADSIIPLFEDINIEWDITDNLKRQIPIKCPHYFMIYGANTEDDYVNAGFMMQQMDLFLSSMNLGSCWLGMVKPAQETKEGKDYIIGLGFGKANGTPHRKPDKFDREPMEKICRGYDSRMECARIAPSAKNKQRWYFVCEENKIHVYRKELEVSVKTMGSKLNIINMGIPVFHLYLATLHEGKNFQYKKHENTEEIPGHKYMGTVSD